MCGRLAARVTDIPQNISFSNLHIFFAKSSKFVKFSRFLKIEICTYHERSIFCVFKKFPKYWKFPGEIAQISRNFRIFRKKPKICTYHERSNFGVKKCFFFWNKIPQNRGKNSDFREIERWIQKCARAKTAAEWHRTGWSSLKIRAASAFGGRAILVFFKNILEILKIFEIFHICTYHERSIFGVFKECQNFQKFSKIVNFPIFAKISKRNRQVQTE